MMIFYKPLKILLFSFFKSSKNPPKFTFLTVVKNLFEDLSKFTTPDETTFNNAENLFCVLAKGLAQCKSWSNGTDALSSATCSSLKVHKACSYY